MAASENTDMFQPKKFFYFLLEILFDDQVYFNTRVPTQVNTNQHKSDTSQHKSTRVDASQHESDTSQHKSTRVNTTPTRVNTNQHKSTRVRHESKRINTSPTQINTSLTQFKTSP